MFCSAGLRGGKVVKLRPDDIDAERGLSTVCGFATLHPEGALRFLLCKPEFRYMKWR